MRSAELKNRLRLYQRRLKPAATSRNFAAPDIDLAYAFGLPPEKAIEYFKAKGFAFSWDWQEVWQQAHTLAFTVAKAMRMDVLQTIRDEMQRVFDEGVMLRDFQKNLEPKLKALGWWGRQVVGDETGGQEAQLGSPYRLRTIYDTNVRTGYQAGRWREFMESADDAPYGQLVAVLDANTRPSHRALHGLVFRLDDPFWNTHWPPLDWGCR